MFVAPTDVAFWMHAGTAMPFAWPSFPAAMTTVIFFATAASSVSLPQGRIARYGWQID